MHEISTRMKLLTVFVAVVLHVFTTEVLSACELASRIKRNDSEVIVTQTDQPCTLTLTSRNSKQVVVVMYDVTTDCVTKDTVAIYDGNSSNSTLITKRCQANPWSFASRSRSLTLKPVPGKPLRPFSLDIHTIDTRHSYLNETGTIRSQRYLGHNLTTQTTPNNFHGVYYVIAKSDVTMILTFQEFRVNDGGDRNKCQDYVQISSRTSVFGTFCGDNVLPQPLSTVTKKLTIEFFTDNTVAYTGFTAKYSVCSKEITVNEANGVIDFQPFQHTKNMTCAYIINVQGNTKITVSLKFGGNGKCRDIFKYTSAGTTYTPDDCTLEEDEYTGSIPASGNVDLRFTFNSGQSVTGNFSKGSPSDNNSVIIPVVVSLAVVLVIIIIVAVVFLRKRLLQKAGKAPGARYQPDLGEVDVYADNEDYDQLRTQRDHKMASNDKNSNIYGVTHAPRDEYAVVNKTKKGMNLQPTEEYDQQEFGNEYDATATSKSSKNVSNDNFYE